LGMGVIGSPMTYEIDGVQYVSIMVGWGGAFALTGGYAMIADMTVKNAGRILTFALDGKQTLAALPKNIPSLSPIASNAAPETVAKGQLIYAQWCAVCHGLGALGGGGVLPALPMSKPAVFEMYDDIVLNGSSANAGMPDFGKYLSKDDVAAIRAYVIQRRTEMASGK
jgi:quinohemoprotein ethanol dehydrogenase